MCNELLRTNSFGTGDSGPGALEIHYDVPGTPEPRNPDAARLAQSRDTLWEAFLAYSL
jgi:hypothetical protein